MTVTLPFVFGAIALTVGTIFPGGISLPSTVVGHEGSTVLVSLNGLRLLGYLYKRFRVRYGTEEYREECTLPSKVLANGSFRPDQFDGCTRKTFGSA